MRHRMQVVAKALNYYARLTSLLGGGYNAGMEKNKKDPWWRRDYLFKGVKNKRHRQIIAVIGLILLAALILNISIPAIKPIKRINKNNGIDEYVRIYVIEDGQVSERRYDENDSWVSERRWAAEGVKLILERTRDGTSGISERRYDENGELTGENTYALGYSLMRKAAYGGKLVAERGFDADGEPLFEYLYDEDGELVAERRYEDGKLRTVWEFDDSGSVLRRDYDADGELISEPD